MKKCPYCAEDIQDEAILCKYCGSDISDSVQVNNQKSKPEITEKLEPHDKVVELNNSKVFFAFIFLVLTNWVIGFLVYYISSFLFGYDSDSAVVVGGLANLITRIVLGSWAVQDRSRNNELNGWSKFGIFILAFLPIGSWFAITYAARHITRKNKFGTLVFVGLLSIGLSIVIFTTTITLANSIFTQESLEPIHITATPKYVSAVSTPRPRSTSSPAQTSDSLFYPNSTLKCIKWSKVTRSYLGKEICIYGIIKNVVMEEYYALEFSSSWEDFKLLDVNNYYWPDAITGDCIMIKGVVRDNVKYIYLSPFINGRPTDLYEIDDDYCIR